jgi:hypothetical protein
MGYPENQVYPISADTERDRIRAAAANRARPATASNPITKLIAGVTAMVRELSYPQMTPANSYFIKIPPFGTIILLLGYLGFILGLEFYNDWVDGAQHWEAFGLRAALLTVAQLPLLILLGGKNNLIGFLVGVSYERLQILHRWVARTLFLTATLHMANQLYGWGVYGLVSLERDTDTCWPTGTSTRLTTYRSLLCSSFVGRG